MCWLIVEFWSGIWWILRDLHSLTLQLQKQRIASWFCASPDWTRECSFLLHRISHTNAAWWCDLGFESDSLLETITGVDICSQQDSMRFPLPLHLQDCFWENLIGWPRRHLVWVPIVKQYEISVKRRSVAKPCRTNTSLHPRESSSYPSGTSKVTVTGSFFFQSSLPSALDLALTNGVAIALSLLTQQKLSQVATSHLDSNIKLPKSGKHQIC